MYDDDTYKKANVTLCYDKDVHHYTNIVVIAGNVGIKAKWQSSNMNTANLQ